MHLLQFVTFQCENERVSSLKNMNSCPPTVDCLNNCCTRIHGPLVSFITFLTETNEFMSPVVDTLCIFHNWNTLIRVPKSFVSFKAFLTESHEFTPKTGEFDWKYYQNFYIFKTIQDQMTCTKNFRHLKMKSFLEVFLWSNNKKEGWIEKFSEM